MRRRLAHGLAMASLVASLGAAQGPNNSEATPARARSVESKPEIRKQASKKAPNQKAPYQVGTASWYGSYFDGKPTASGEAYDMHDLTAAHPTLPLGSYVRVTNLHNGRAVVVRVNDRGPIVQGRIIDLSYTAAHRLGIAQTGSGEVEVESVLASGAPATPVVPLRTVAASEAVVATPMPVVQEAGGYVVQLGAFANNVNAQAFVEHVANQIAPLGVEANVHEDAGLYRVSVGPYPTRDEAKRTADRLRAALGLDSTIKPR